ncbi:hypothetical protein [Tardiphaga sp. 803_E3_N1_3]|uniref:hypothetical protein n=1 Tax=Tardiphaga sp. 803_E3_N1_3 TaxID=3240785 RepID=UPI003F29942D
MTVVQELDESLIVNLLAEREFAQVSYETNFHITTSQGEPGIFAVRCLNRSLLVGTQSDLTPALARLINCGSFDSVPLLRFRLSAFCGMSDRIADDAKSAWTWLRRSASQWSADNWKVESTIRPEIMKNVAMRLRAAGEGVEVIDTISRAVDVQIAGEETAVLIRMPASEPWAARCRDLLQADVELLGDAAMWWPELKNCSLRILDAQESVLQTLAAAPLNEILSGAKKFLEDQLFAPAQNDPAIPKALRNRFANTRILVSQFEKIGDLVLYIERFSRKNARQMQFNLPTSHASMESIHDEFIGVYGQYREYSSDIMDLKIGKNYSGTFLSILSRSYTNRSGGIRPVGKVGHHKAVVIKATIDGMKYQNEWIEQGVRLKYYLNGVSYRGRTKYNEGSPANRSIIDYPDLPILVFIKEQDRPSLYSFRGIFSNTGVVTEADGAKWFNLVKR